MRDRKPLTPIQLEVWSARFWSKLAVKAIRGASWEEEGSNSWPIRKKAAQAYRVLARKHLTAARTMRDVAS